MTEDAPTPGRASRQALIEMRRPLFRAEWRQAVFIHYEVEPGALQPRVPFPLHLRHGRAYVSLVAFTLERMRLHGLGTVGRWLIRPFSDHGFLNVRTYVRAGGETGIYFLAEWLSSRFPVPWGRPMFGLPYHYARLDYRHGGPDIAGRIRNRVGEIAYHARMEEPVRHQASAAGSLDEFLLERYVAFTWWRGLARRFRVWHEPWQQIPIPLRVDKDSLLATTGDWLRRAHRSGAHYSPGAAEVWMGPPEVLRNRCLGAARQKGSGCSSAPHPLF